MLMVRFVGQFVRISAQTLASCSRAWGAALVAAAKVWLKMSNEAKVRIAIRVICAHDSREPLALKRSERYFRLTTPALAAASGSIRGRKLVMLSRTSLSE